PERLAVNWNLAVDTLSICVEHISRDCIRRSGACDDHQTVWRYFGVLRRVARYPTGDDAPTQGTQAAKGNLMHLRSGPGLRALDVDLFGFQSLFGHFDRTTRKS